MVENHTSDSFIIMVDRIEGEYAISEFPDGSIPEPGIKLCVFPFEVKEKERYRMKYGKNGELEFVSKAQFPQSLKSKIHSKLIRFS